MNKIIKFNFTIFNNVEISHFYSTAFQEEYLYGCSFSLDTQKYKWMIVVVRKNEITRVIPDLYQYDEAELFMYSTVLDIDLCLSKFIEFQNIVLSQIKNKNYRDIILEEKHFE